MTRRALSPYMCPQDLRYEETAGMPAVSLQLPWWLSVLLLAAAFFAGPARAGVDLRVEAAPISAPIQAFVTVTDAAGAPVGGLSVSDFTVTLDGAAIQPASFTLPPSQDPNQKVSVVFVMDCSFSVQQSFLAVLQDAVTSFINAMNDGDFAAIVKFSSVGGASVVQPFTEISGAGKSVLISAVMAPFPDGGTNLLDALDVGIDQFSAPSVSLPIGPKALILVSDGEDTVSTTTPSDVIDNAAAHSIPIFTVGVGTVTATSLDLIMRLTDQTGGQYLPAPSDAEIAAAYATISDVLSNEYLLTISSSISDCNQHTMQVSVTGQATPASVTFARCVPPPPAPPPSGGGGGGGGAVGVVELLAGLVALVAGRRRRRWTICS